jgi:hypothetical protein
MVNVDDLIAQSLSSRTVNNSQCWARKLDGLAKEYLTALEDKPVADVYQKKVSELLASLGFDVSSGQVGAHLNKKCKCRI